jgi:hypothetical protein
MRRRFFLRIVVRRILGRCWWSQGCICRGHSGSHRYGLACQARSQMECPFWRLEGAEVVDGRLEIGRRWKVSWDDFSDMVGYHVTQLLNI